MKHPHTLAKLLTAFLLATLMLTSVQARELQSEFIDGLIVIENAEANMDLAVRLTTPDGRMLESVRSAGPVTAIDVMELLVELEDGLYRYEIHVQPPPHMLVSRHGEDDYSLPAEAYGGITPSPAEPVTGTLRVVNGSFLNPVMED